MRKLLFGCDPEIFAVSGNVPEKYADHLEGVPFVEIPAYIADSGLIQEIPGGGDAKHPEYLSSKYHRVVGDGAAYEINLKFPCTSPIEMRDHVLNAEYELSERLKVAGFSVWRKPVVNFDFKRFWTEENMQDERKKMSMIFGCDPDIDAFEFQLKPAEEDVSQHPYRYGGGHLHFSGDIVGNLMETKPLPFVKMLAVFLGNFTTLVSPFSDLDKIRATRYGKPGKYRRQVYKDGTIGVEYRTPSNSWMSLPIEEYTKIFDLFNHVLDIMCHPADSKKILREYSYPTIEAITSADKVLSKQILESLGV